MKQELIELLADLCKAEIDKNVMGRYAKLKKCMEAAESQTDDSWQVFLKQQPQLEKDAAVKVVEEYVSSTLETDKQERSMFVDEG